MLVSELPAGPAQGCGGYLSMPMGMFGSPDPNLDEKYEPRMDCLWIIEMPVNKAVNLSFNSFELESSSTCRYDYVKVRAYSHWNINMTFLSLDHNWIEYWPNDLVTALVLCKQQMHYAFICRLSTNDD